MASDQLDWMCQELYELLVSVAVLDGGYRLH